MPRMTVAQAERDFVNLVNQVESKGISVELARGDQVIARLVPAGPRRTVEEILSDIAQNRFNPDPDGPCVVDMLREDRNR